MSLLVRSAVGLPLVFVAMLAGCAHSQAALVEESADLDHMANVAPAQVASAPTEAMLFAQYPGSARLVLGAYAAEAAPLDLHAEYNKNMFVEAAPLGKQADYPKRVWVHDRSGAVCPAHVEALQVQARLLPEEYFDTEVATSAPSGWLASGKETPASIWTKSAGDHWITAHASIESGNCPQPVFARTAQTRADVFAESPVAVSVELAGLARTEFEQLAAHRKLAAEFGEYRAHLSSTDRTQMPAKWDSDSRATYTFLEYRSLSDARVLWVSVRAGEGCEAFSASLSALYREDHGKLTLISAFEGVAASNVTAVIEHAGDAIAPNGGQPAARPEFEILMPDQRLRLRESGEVDVFSVELPSHSCGC